MTHEGGDGQASRRPCVSMGSRMLLDLLGESALCSSSEISTAASCGVCPVGGNVDLHEGGGAGVDGLVVHVDDVLALLQVGLA